jgi:phosphorylcholine metabolism protein LicD
MFKRPTSLEQAFIAFFKKYNLPYTYVGNGAVIIGMKNPDFVNLEEKICIEVRPKETCKIWSKCTPEEYELRQVTHYSKYYWNCVVLWKEMLENEQSILDKIAKIRSEDVFLPKCSLTAQ